MNVKLENSPIIDTWNSKPRLQVRYILLAIFWIFELLLVIRFALKLFSPHVTSVLEKTIFNLTDFLLIPFTASLQISMSIGPVFEWITLLAILFYWLLMSAMMALLYSTNNMSDIEIARAYSKRKYGH